MTSALVAFAFVLQTGSAMGGVITCDNSWLNPGTNGVWDSAGNWTDGIPNNTDHVCLGPSVTPYTVTLDNNVAAAALELVVQNNAGLNIKGTSATTLTVGNFVSNAGTVVIGQSAAHLPAALNVTTGTFTNLGSVSALGLGGNHLGANISNQGTITATSPNGSLFLDKTSGTITNTGTITANSTIDVSTNSSFILAGGTINGSFPMTIRGGTFEHTGGTTAMTGSGRVNLTGNVTLKVNPAGGPSGTFVVQQLGNTLATDIGSGETLILEGNVANIDAVLTSSASRVNNGTIRLSATSNTDTKTAKLLFTGGSTLTNNGTITTEANPALPDTDTTAGRVIEATLVNNDLINIDYHTFFDQAAATFIQNTDGTVNLNDTLDLDGSAEALALAGGMLTGNGTLIGTLINQGGNVAPGSSPGILTVSAFSQFGGGTLSMEISGDAAGAESDRLAVTGNASLAGTLALSTINGFVPDPPFAYDFMTYASHGNTFGTVSGTNAGNGRTWQVGYADTGGATLTVTVAAITRQPDGQIALGTGTFSGNNIYNLDGTNQSKSKTVKAGKTVTFFIKVQNDGTGAKDKFNFDANGAAATGYTITFKHGTTNITTAVNNGTYTTGKVSVGKSVIIKCTVVVKSSAGHGSHATRLVTITSFNNSSIQDAVQLTAGRI